MSANVFQKGGYDYITAEIKRAIESGSRTAVITGHWEIDKAVRLPSNITLILENCYLKMAKDCYSNMFLNEHYGTELGRTLEGTDTNITIKGKGYAIIDGGGYNGLTERTQCKNGLPSMWNQNPLIFHNVDGFCVRDLTVRNQRWWALTFICSRNGYVGNIDFCSEDTAFDSEGKEYHQLDYDKYEDVLVKNSDGVDIRLGCHDILIENLTGFIEDDTVALTSGTSSKPGCGETDKFCVEGHTIDTYNITIRNIRTASFCSMVRLLCQGGQKLHDITVDGVYDQSDVCPHLVKGFNAVKVGDLHMYGCRHAEPDEVYNITIKNVYAAGRFAVKLIGGMTNVVLQNIECKEGTQMLEDLRNIENETK
jgi:hypothetical protein